MNTLHKNDALSNTNITITHDRGCLYSDVGLVLVEQALHVLDFDHLINIFIFTTLVPILNTVIQVFRTNDSSAPCRI